MDLKSRIKSLFTEGLLIEKADVSNIIGKKKILKKQSVKKSKIKSKRKNNFKTQDARRILASKHGVSNALKKMENKYVMDYAEIAKLMRKYSYTFNKDKGSWLKKKDVGSEVKSTSTKATIEPTSNKPETSKPKESKKAKIKVAKIDDIEDKLKSDKSSSMKKSSNIEDKNVISNESMKSYQGRLISYLLNSNNEEGGWLDAIQIVDEEPLEFYLPKESIYEYLSNQDITWIEDRKVWVDIDGDYPISNEIHNGRIGITARAILANNGFINFLNVDEVSDEETLDSIRELGYNWGDGMWVKPEITTEIVKRQFPELVTNDIIGTI
jgi:hypothetical protein